GVDCPRDLSEDIEAMRTLLWACSLQIGGLCLAVTVPASAMQRVCKSELSLDPRCRSGVGHQLSEFRSSIGITPAFYQQLGSSFPLRHRRSRSSVQLEQLRVRRISIG